MTIVIILIVMWLGVMTFFYLKADEVTKNPCQICAKKLGTKVTCSITGTTDPTQKEFYPNYTIIDKEFGG